MIFLRISQIQSSEKFKSLVEKMAKVKNAFTMVKLVSAAKTGYEKWFQIPRKTGKLHLILYDPRAKRHCLFTESKKRRIQEPPPKDFFRRHRV